MQGTQCHQGAINLLHRRVYVLLSSSHQLLQIVQRQPCYGVPCYSSHLSEIADGIAPCDCMMMADGGFKRLGHQQQRQRAIRRLDFHCTIGRPGMPDNWQCDEGKSRPICTSLAASAAST
ncbi:hypothetical protein SE17_00255 [Kouleothrix aurantiaca]|uniref:Uncharacterized protein n=1 Tax=Kouleothrix aurantiaca TaxID=186479 RepID=A0A0P9HJ28_9CHLR|nr:hypothetical protein SE17_00255 [Kouleothrix aurantiaca]